jgi:two-component system KDP operon response regulator KdpE
VLRSALIKRGYEVGDARSGEEALEILRAETPSVIFLDLTLPGLSGLETCAEIRSRSEVPIVFLSACHSKGEEVQAFYAGVDGYIGKPLGIEESVARIRAVIRRADTFHRPRTITLGDVEIDLESHEVTRGYGEVQHLTAKEFKLLYYLFSHAGKIIAHRRLLQAVWGPDYGDEVACLRVCINQLRKKVEPNPAKPRYILTEPHEGYSFVQPPGVRDSREEVVLGRRQGEPREECGGILRVDEKERDSSAGPAVRRYGRAAPRRETWIQITFLPPWPVPLNHAVRRSAWLHSHSIPK